MHIWKEDTYSTREKWKETILMKIGINFDYFCFKYA